MLSSTLGCRHVAKKKKKEKMPQKVAAKAPIWTIFFAGPQISSGSRFRGQNPPNRQCFQLFRKMLAGIFSKIYQQSQKKTRKFEAFGSKIRFLTEFGARQKKSSKNSPWRRFFGPKDFCCNIFLAVSKTK